MESMMIYYFFLIYFSKIYIEYIVNIIPTEINFLKISYSSSITEVYKQEQILHSNFIILLTTLISPIFEEIFFRCFLLKIMLKYKLSVIQSIFIDSFLFGSSHINFWKCVNSFLMSFFICMIYYRTKSLFSCILSHSLNNIITIILSFICKKTSLWSSIFLTFIGLCLTLHLFVKQSAK